ncbi:MAG TPA: HupE/UreJ family protein [Candidatus Sulfotelmatobacter sp.]|nr:HupE/UreJ family protein [Candidatus Sulfotelmatobacter sp.]
MNWLALLGLGLALGIRHATDPDHVVAVAAITARTRRWLPAAAIGAMWGLGHTLTLFVVGALIIAFNLTVPPRIGLAMEFAVALALIAVGAFNLGHRHGAAPSPAGEAPLPAGRAFGVGLVHGLAGSAAVALLVLSLIREPLWACGYLLLFGLGTLIGMVLITTGFAVPLSTASRRWPRFERAARFATGAASVAFGVWLVWRIGFVDGLFRASPHWTPH